MSINKITRMAVIAASLALAMASTAFAATNSGKILLSQGATVNGTTLKAGSYNAKWEGEANNVTLRILDGNKVVATVPAHMVDLGSKADNNAVLLTGATSVRSIAQIQFAGNAHALDLTGSDSSKPMGN